MIDNDEIDDSEGLHVEEEEDSDNDNEENSKKDEDEDDMFLQEDF